MPRQTGDNHWTRRRKTAGLPASHLRQAVTARQVLARMDARERNDKSAAAQLQAVRDRLQDPQRAAAREGIRLEAQQAGLSDDMVAAAVDAAMSAWEDLRYDAEAWEDMVASVIQGHAMP